LSAKKKKKHQEINVTRDLAIGIFLEDEQLILEFGSKGIYLISISNCEK
jgi:hypothetical protein